MLEGTETSIDEQAIAWHLKLPSGSDEDWVAFAAWLEADPQHNEAYEDVVRGEGQWSPLLGEAVFPAMPSDPAEPGPALASNDVIGPTRRPWLWGALAASIAVAGLVGLQLGQGDDRYAVRTAPGETRTLALEGGGRIVLNGDTRLVLDRDDPRFAELQAGEARFEIVHDPSAPFTVQLGDRRLVDIGTTFNVVRLPAELRVGVAEGSVRYEGATKNLELRPGDVLTVAGEAATLSNRAASAIGSWVEGTLVYRDAPLSEVARDLSRSLGVEVELAPAASGRRFSGVIQTGGGRDAVRQRLQPVLGLKVAETPGGWLLQP